MSPLEPVSASHYGGKFITIDRQHRLMISAELRREFSSVGTDLRLHVAYDPENKRIGIAKPEMVRKSATNSKPHKFDARGYTSAKSVMKKAGWTEITESLRFEDDGTEHVGNDKWRVFSLVATD